MATSQAASHVAEGIVLVTGANGFLGRHVVQRLLRAGYKVVGVSRSADAARALSDAYQHLQVDLGEVSSVGSLVKAAHAGTCTVVHLAAVFPPSLTSPEAAECGRQNKRIDRNVIEASRRLQSAVVYASTASVYATDTTANRVEEGPILDARAYAREKLQTEREATDLLADMGLPFTALRITAPYGTGQVSRTVVRIFLDRAVQNEPLMYHGSGSREQDFVHASDVANAVLAAVEKAPSGIFNIGCGAPVTMRELAETVVRAVPNCRSSVEPSGIADPEERRYARISVAKAAAQLGWHPRTTLEDGLRQWAAFLGGRQGDANCDSV